MIGALAPEGQVRAFATVFMDHDTQRTLSQAQTDAGHFDVLVAHPHQYKGLVPQMHSVNPRCTVFIYSNGTANVRTDLAESMYAHDRYGKRIQITGWKANLTWLMDPASSTWRSYLRDLIQSNLAASGYDAVYIDVLGGAGVSVPYVATVPWNNGAAWTKHDWYQATRDLAGWMRQQTGRLVFGNGWGDGAAYFSASTPSSLLTDPGASPQPDGFEAEGWLRGANQAVTSYPSVTRWKQNVDLLADAHAKGVSSLNITKVWVSATAVQKHAWLVYTVASYLLGNQGGSYVMFSDQSPAYASTPRPGYYDLDLGAALGPYQASGAAFMRVFDRGRVIVNPSPGAVTVAGKLVAAKTGVILQP